MFLRLTLVFATHDQSAIDDLLDKALDHFDDALTINQGKDNAEPSLILTQKCYHDEDPNRPCEQIFIKTSDS